MQVRLLQIRNFRGIQSLDWIVPNAFVCLVGPGDSTKSTILDAIDQALTPRWNAAFTDADFYCCDPTEPIRITVTLGELPEKVMAGERFECYLRGWQTDREELLDEPEEGSEPVISVRLEVDSALEPHWFLWTERHGEGVQQLTPRDRERLGSVRLGVYVDRHLSWGRASALSRCTEELGSFNGMMGAVARSARSAFHVDAAPELTKTATRVADAARKLGAQPKEHFCPGLDHESIKDGGGALALFDGDIPFRQSGLGSRRLTVLAMQRETVPSGAIALIDEVETALEPHRVRHLIKELKPKPGGLGQVLMTSHSPIAVSEAGADGLCVVRSKRGATSVVNVDPHLNRIVRQKAEAVLAARILVCEGPTEMGLFRAAHEFWQLRMGGTDLEAEGLQSVDGQGGPYSMTVAQAFADLEFPTAFFGDSDTKLPGADKARESGVTMIRWEDGRNLETAILSDLPVHALQEVIDWVVEATSPFSVAESLADLVGGDPKELQGSVDNISRLGLEESALRQAIIEASLKSKKGWFKKADGGAALGRIAFSHWKTVALTPTGRTLGELHTWCYAK